MARFETVREATRRFGTNSYLELARKRLVEDSGAASEFLVLTRGFFESDGSKRWTKFVTVPNDADLVTWLARALLAEVEEGASVKPEGDSSGTEGGRA